METETFSFLKALCNVHWMESCRDWFLLLPLACFTFHWTSKADVYHRNLTVIHLTVLPPFRAWTYWLMLQVFTLSGSLLFNCVVKNSSVLFKNPLSLLIIVWQFTRIEIVPLLNPCSPLQATGEQVWKASSVRTRDPIRNQGCSTTDENCQLGTWCMLGNKQKCSQRLKALWTEERPGAHTEAAQPEAVPRQCPSHRNISFQPSAPTQTCPSDSAVRKTRLHLNPWDGEHSKLHLMQESLKQHLKSIHCSAVKNRPTTKSPILWTKPGKPPLRDTPLSDPAKSKQCPNYQTTEVSLATFSSKSLLMLQTNLKAVVWHTPSFIRQTNLISCC